MSSPRKPEPDGLGQHEVDPMLIAQARKGFAAYGFAKIPFVVPDRLKDAVAREVRAVLDEVGTRRDLRFKATGNTPRRMYNARRDEIAAVSELIPAVYDSPALTALLTEIVGEPVLPCPYEPEQYVATRLENPGDTHGWHWDDYAFALVWVIDSPPADNGGFVQCVPGTTWDKQNPSINRALLSGPTYSFELVPGDLYLMRTDTTLHRVYPVSSGIRTIINMGYASAADLEREISHETMDELWSAEIREEAKTRSAS
ncbi:hypothetical protein KGA66_23185 [Actinocrinis puniceicyclus]|uniref:Fe2OG dioxygenase domain-containing protein n=1 Tax=Actinocrinis puniceicyclus TaxID=977794 RepID=A0A8J7WTN9_9ACTN|nr:hypothetical protein [Actinocrinis puniceicyclus]MBS2965969.1 hypothetical protein [Actinocrinis puniceicyclus]